MSFITNCPACQTQFIVSEEQLNQHNGKVRCGHCLHVFDAKEQLVDSNTQPENNLAFTDDVIADAPLVYDSLLNDAQAPITEVEVTGSSASSTDDAATDTVDYSTPDTYIDEIVSITLTSEDQPSYFDDAVGKTKLQHNNAEKKSHSWLWLLFALVLLLIAIAQSIYFLRNEIAIYYPNIKPYLVQACKQIACSIDLPKKIEFIVIDDSDIQEDADYTGLMRLSSTLINQAGFSQAYPDLELTLTDVEDKPKLRRTFKPSEYLPEHTDIANGLAPGEEVKIKLAMTTQGVTVAGYRVFVTY